MADSSWGEVMCQLREHKEWMTVRGARFCVSCRNIKNDRQFVGQGYVSVAGTYRMADSSWDEVMCQLQEHKEWQTVRGTRLCVSCSNIKNYAFCPQSVYWFSYDYLNKQRYSILHGAESFLRTNRFSASQEIPCILWNPNFITALTTARHLSLS